MVINMKVDKSELPATLSGESENTERPIELVSPDDLAKELHTTVGTLATWRSTKRVNLPYTKIGNKVLYLRSGVEDLKRRQIHGQGEAAA
jgi:hypothetical protein